MIHRMDERTEGNINCYDRKQTTKIFLYECSHWICKRAKATTENASIRYPAKTPKILTFHNMAAMCRFRIFCRFFCFRHEEGDAKKKGKKWDFLAVIYGIGEASSSIWFCVSSRDFRSVFRLFNLIRAGSDSREALFGKVLKIIWKLLFGFLWNFFSSGYA